MLACSIGKSRLFRNNIGAMQNERGDWIRFGVGGKGGSDLLGWTQVEITEEHLGKQLAIFTAVEVKKKGNKPTDDQEMFLNMVIRAGGIAGVATSPKEAKVLLGH